MQNNKLRRFLLLRDPKRFLSVVRQATERFLVIKRNNADAQVFWFHISSAGELEQAIPIAKLLHEQCQAYFFITYFSPSAEPFLKNFPGQLGVSGLPIDQVHVYESAHEMLKFTKLFFIRYDIWPSLVTFAQHNKIDLYLIAATAQKTRQGICGYISLKWSQYLYNKFKVIFVSTQNDYKIFKAQFPRNSIVLAGDSKWKRAKDRAESFQKRLSEDIEKTEFISFINACQRYVSQFHKKCIVFGSPHQEEHDLALQVANLSNFLVIYVPHNVSTESCQNIETELKEKNINYCLYSHFKRISALDPSLSVIVFDQVGHLAELYSLGGLAVVGGGFDGQIHNVLEPASHHVPVLIGDSYNRAPEAALLVKSKAALSFGTPNLLFQFIRRWGTLVGTMKELEFARAQANQLFERALDTEQIILNTLLQENQAYAYKTTHNKHNRL